MEDTDRYPYDEMFVPGERLKALCSGLPTPFYLYDETGLRRTARAIREAFSWCADFREFFPVRLTPNPVIMRLLREEGLGAACCSATELALAEWCGFYGDELLYDTVFPDREALHLADRLHAAFVADSFAAADACLMLGFVPKKVVLRYNPGGKVTAGLHTIAHPERSKLGMDREALFASLRAFRESGVKRFGLQTTLTTQTLEPRYLEAVVQLLLPLAEELQTVLGVRVESCNLSGGAGLGFLPELPNADLFAMADRVRRLAGAAGCTVPELHTEFGRYLTGQNGIFVSRVLCVKSSYRNYLVLDGTLSQFIRPMTNAYHHVSIAGKMQRSERTYYDVVSAMPDIAERFAVRRLLPRAEVGDLCVIHDAGFRGAAMQTGFGGSLRCAEYLYTASAELRQIARADTSKDYFRAW